MLCKSLVCLGIVILGGIANGVSSSEHILSADQRLLVADIKEVLQDELTEDFMNSEYYLTNWLRANEFNVKDTKKAIKRALKFRKEQDIANILNEDWSDMRALFPYSRDTVDKTGQPLVYADIGKWDIASFLTTNEASDRMIRYHIMINEESEAHVRRLRAKGKNVSQFSYLSNIAGFSAAKHLCKNCLQVYSKIVKQLTPATANTDKVFIVNVPNQFKMVYLLWGQDARKRVQLFGQDQTQVAKLLKEHIDHDQLPSGVLNHIVNKENSEGLLVWDKEL